MRTATIVAAHIALLVCIFHVPPATASQLAITNVHVVDVDTGQILPGQNVLIDGKQIHSISSKPVSADQVIDGNGAYLIPGLIDMHVHIGPGDIEFFLRYGVTTIRDMGTQTTPLEPLSGLLKARTQIDSGERAGPEVFTPGLILDGDVERNPKYTPHFRTLASTAEAEQLVDQLAAANVDFLKVYSNLSEEVFLAIAERARHHGLSLAGHLPHSVSLQQAADANMRTIEHLRSILIDLAGKQAQIRDELAAAVATRDPGAESKTYGQLTPQMLNAQTELQRDQVFALMRNNGMAWTPTLTVLFDPRWDNPDAVPDPALLANFSRLYQAIMTPYGPAEYPYDTVKQARDMFAETQHLVGLAHRAGVDILVGTDSANAFAVPGHSIHQELQFLVDSGLSPHQALRAATLVNARYLNAQDRLGSIAVGNEADLVLLKRNPLEDISATKGILKVIVNGVRHR
ncbi:MAG: amidohydrolase [Lysobacteraceae bacterium]|nr:MAG: amidohydrolase [Xanthomonadaceae bacterium]